MSRRAIVIGFPSPVFVNEALARQAIVASTIFVNDTTPAPIPPRPPPASGPSQASDAGEWGAFKTRSGQRHRGRDVLTEEQRRALAPRGLVGGTTTPEWREPPPAKAESEKARPMPESGRTSGALSRPPALPELDAAREKAIAVGAQLVLAEMRAEKAMAAAEAERQASDDEETMLLILALI